MNLKTLHSLFEDRLEKSVFLNYKVHDQFIALFLAKSYRLSLFPYPSFAGKKMSTSIHLYHMPLILVPLMKSLFAMLYGPLLSIAKVE